MPQERCANAQQASSVPRSALSQPSISARIASGMPSKVGSPTFWLRAVALLAVLTLDFSALFILSDDFADEAFSRPSPFRSCLNMISVSRANATQSRNAGYL